VLQPAVLQTAQQVLPYALQTSILILFGILFCWVSAGFWTALMGFLELLDRSRQVPHLRRQRR
jgi:membrane glycosyltransferase